MSTNNETIVAIMKHIVSISETIRSEDPAQYNTGKNDIAMTDAIQAALNDPAASNWLKGALLSGLLRDPVDAANDAEILSQLLAERCELLLLSMAQAESVDN